MKPAPSALLLLAGLLALPAAPRAQQPAPPAGDALRLFLDCSGFFCDPDFYRTEIAFVSHVRNRQDADVHLLVTTQPTGGGGTEYTLHLLGQRRFQGSADTLRYVAPETATEDERRRGIAGRIKLGLVPYVVDTPLASRLQLTYSAAEGAGAPASAGRDPWDHWAFRTRVGGFFDGESSYESMSLNAAVSAARTTDAWKSSLSVSTYYSRSSYDLDEGETVTNLQRNHEFAALLVRSLGRRLSAGVRAGIDHSPYVNRDLGLRLAPAVEYNLFPYAESTRRQLTFQYSVGANQVDYERETLFGKVREGLLDQTLVATYEAKQRWGSISTALEGVQYFHDASKYRLQARTEMDLRVFKGLSFNLWGQAERIRDQLYIPKGELSSEEILTRQRQLATSFRYFGSLGLSYTFGSIFNNVVNPRFGSGR